MARPRIRAPLPGGETSISAGTCSVLGQLPFRRIVDVPFETCLAAVESGQRTRPDGELRIGESRVRGPIGHDRDSGTHRIEVRLARGPLRPLLHMRLNIDRWSSSSTALELIPCGRVRPSAAYFRAGHLLLDSLVRSLSQPLPAGRAHGTESQARAIMGPGRPLFLRAPHRLPVAGVSAVPGRELAFPGVGGERGEPVPVEVGEPQLRARVQALPADVDPHPGRPGGQVQQAGDVRDPGPAPLDQSGAQRGAAGRTSTD